MKIQEIFIKVEHIVEYIKISLTFWNFDLIYLK